VDELKVGLVRRIGRHKTAERLLFLRDSHDELPVQSPPIAPLPCVVVSPSIVRGRLRDFCLAASTDVVYERSNHSRFVRRTPSPFRLRYVAILHPAIAELCVGKVLPRRQDAAGPYFLEGELRCADDLNRRVNEDAIRTTRHECGA
jgi:hypothetical protein